MKVLVELVIAVALVSQYGAGRAESVIRVRQAVPPVVSATLPVHLPYVNGYIAVLECEHIGETWYLRHIDTDGTPLSPVESFLVIDCAGDEPTRQWMQRGDGTLPIAAEVDWNTALRWGIPGRGARVEIVEIALGHQWY